MSVAESRPGSTARSSCRSRMGRAAPYSCPAGWRERRSRAHTPVRTSATHARWRRERSLRAFPEGDELEDDGENDGDPEDQRAYGIGLGIKPGAQQVPDLDWQGRVEPRQQE